MTPEDELAAPHFRNERSVQIAAAPRDVWPWLAQMGFGRAGWYSWDLVDNLGRRSATELHPAWMLERAGNRVPGGPIDFEATVVDPPGRLVLDLGRRVLLRWSVEFRLAYHLAETADGCALTAVATGRIDGPLGKPAARWLLGPGDSAMVRKQLRGIRDRCEATSGEPGRDRSS